MNKLKLWLKWYFGITLLVIGFVFLFSTSFIGGFLFILGGLFLIPRTLKIMEEQAGKTVTSSARNTIVVVCVIIGLVFVGSNKANEIEKEKIIEQEAFEKLPKHVQDSLKVEQAKQDSLVEVAKELNRIKDEQSKRTELVQKQFSYYDGSHPSLTRLIKKAMNDPDSYEHIETRFRDDGNSIFVITEFREKNAFGAKIKNTISARVDFEGNVMEVYP